MNGMRRVQHLIIAMVLILVSPLRAERPFLTEDANRAQKGAVGLELSWDYVAWSSGFSERIALFAAGFAPAERLEFAAEVPYLIHDFGQTHRHEGLGDLNVSMKWYIVDEREIYPAVTLKGIVKANTGDTERGLGSGAIDYVVAAAGTKTFGRFAFHAMAGHQFIGKKGNPDLQNIFVYGLAVRYAMNETLGVVAEIAGNEDPNRHASGSPMVGLMGMVVSLSEAVSFDAALKTGLTSTAPSWNGTVGVSLSL